jgi:uroporphyrinogen-III decarboxylase
MMTSKELMITALRGRKPDRLPVTIHQWQQFHLDEYMDGRDPLDAFKATGMDAAIQYFEAMGQFWIPDAEKYAIQTPQWRDEITVVKSDPDDKIVHHRIVTPKGELTYKTGASRATTWITEYLIKKPDDVDLIERFMPVAKLDKWTIEREYERVGDAGILRGFVWGDQAGCWQHACCLMDVQKLIIETFENPDWVHRLLDVLLEKKLRFIEESLRGARFDLIETGGGAASDTVISPKLYRDFCLPYDRRMHRAVHDAGLITTYHTCGGMMNILDLIVENETDASETLTPPGCGGNITRPELVREKFSGRVAMIGGMDQFNVLTSGSAAEIRNEVRRLFEGFGRDGGYILSTSDHFFDTPVENLAAYAEAARECVY